MMTGNSAARWQEIGWEGLLFQVPAPWQPTAIYPEYIYFEEEGRAAFEIKWRTVRGRFSATAILAQLRENQKDSASLDTWDPPPPLRQQLGEYAVTGFRLMHAGKTSSHGLVLHCPRCGRATLMQFHFDPDPGNDLSARIAGNFRDHPEAPEQVWSVFDIRAVLPGGAKLRSHEFLPGRYTICFDLDTTRLTLYRFKPAAVLLRGKSVETFGNDLLNRQPVEVCQDQAWWKHTAHGLELVLAKARRDPVQQWLHLRHDPVHNVILGVKAEGSRWKDDAWLERISGNFIALEST